MYKAVLGDGVVLVPQRQKTAMRHTRLARLSKVRLFHLWNAEDNGTQERPLKQLESVNQLEWRGYISSAFARMQTILQLAFPAQQAEITIFFPLMSSKLCTMCDERQPVPDMEKWLKVVFHLITKPIQRLAVGDTTVGVEPKLALDVSYVGAVKDHHSEYNESRLKNLAAQGGSVVVLDSESKGSESKSKLLKRTRELEEQVRQLKAAQSPDASLASDEDDVDSECDDSSSERDGGDDGGWGDWDPIDNPAVSHGFSSRAEYQAACDAQHINMGYLKRIKKSHPAIGGRNPCYFFFQPGQTCYKGEACKFHHGN